MPQQKQIPLTPEESDSADAALTGRPTLAEHLGWSKEDYAAVDAAIDERWEQPKDSDPALIRIREGIKHLPCASEDTPQSSPAVIAPVAGTMLVAETTKKINQFLRSDDVWTISFEDELVRLPHLAGLEYIGILLRSPGQSIPSTSIEVLSRAKHSVIHSTDVSHQSYDAVTNEYIAPDRLDSKARTEYKAEARRLADGIAEARDRGEVEKVTTLTEQLEMIEDQMNADTGLAGRSRKERSDLEKARTRVTNAINRAIDKIAERGPRTATHLRSNIETGSSMMYRDALTTWKL
jgi:hypothetical protein